MNMVKEKYLICPHCGTRNREVDFSLGQQEFRCPGCEMKIFLIREGNWLAVQFRDPAASHWAGLKWCDEG